MSMLNKPTLLILSGAGSTVLLIWDYIGNNRLCDFLSYSGREGFCPFTLASTETILLPVIPLFLFSLITYWMRDDIYRAWFTFARWAIPLCMILILISPEYAHDWMFPIEKGTVAFFSSIIFSIISILIIGIKFVASRKSKT